DKRTVAPHYRARLQELALAARTDGGLARAAGQACPVGWSAARLIRCVEHGDWAALERFGPALTSGWLRRQPLGHRVAPIAHRLRRLIKAPGILARRRGLSVVLLGPNGVGKSTLAAGLQRSFCLPARSVYMGLWQAETARRPGL